MDVARASELAGAALRNLEAHRRRIDDLNVYPVPDGDTGTNLTLTVRAVVEALGKSTSAGHEAAAKELSRAALMGARGNSGVIFSQIVRGFAEVLGEHEEIDGEVLSRAFRSASDAAYRAVRRPVEGTMLTVVREMAEEGEQPEVRRLSKEDFLAHMVERGEAALARTPDLLPVLKDAGVVDAGGAGLVEIVRGIAHEVAGTPLPEAPVETEELSFDAVHLELSRYRYCTVFVVEGSGLDAGELERELEVLGDSLLVVGDASALKVHVHTDEPGAALSIGTSRGVIEGIEIANMHRQTVEREERLTARPGPGGNGSGPAVETALVAVSPGTGNRMLFESYGASVVVEGGQTMNPATSDIVEAIEAAPSNDVIVLPNNKNVILAAEQAAGVTSKRVCVLPARSVQAGLAAIVRYMPSSNLEENEQAMLEALREIRTGEVTRASRDTRVDGVDVRAGAWLGLADEEVVACDDDFERVAEAVVQRLLSGGGSLLTVLTGEEAPSVGDLLARVGEQHADLEVAVFDGGQPHYPLLLWAE